MKTQSYLALKPCLSLVIGACICFAVTAPGAGVADLWQARNGSVSTPNMPVEWARGNAGPANSHYVEGQSIPYRMVLSGVTTGYHRLIVEWDTQLSGKHTIDYITHYERLLPHGQFQGHSQPEAVRPLDGLAGFFAEPQTFPIPVPSTAGSPVPGQPAASFSNLPLTERGITIWNGTITNVVYVTEGSLSVESASTQMAIDFLAEDSSVVIAWGGHIASRLDWGDGHSAVAINGSPYHMRKVSLDGAGGNQDRSVQAQAIVSPPVCIISGPETVCAENLVTYQSTLQDTNAVYQWSLTNNTAGAVIIEGGNQPGAQIRAGTNGSFSVQLTVTVENISSVCLLDVQILTPVESTPLAGQTVCQGDLVAFETTPSGSGPFGFGWRKNGSIIPGATNSSLILENVVAADAGDYSVEIQGACGTATSQASLTVRPLPALVAPADLVRECFAEVPPADVASVVVTAGTEPVAVVHLGDTATTNGLEITIVRTYLATDGCGHPASCEQIITVRDITAPEFVCPENMIVGEAPADSGGAVVKFPPPLVSDNCDTNVTVICEPASGSVFPVGANIVVCTAIDAGGNSNQCLFAVRVIPYRLTVTNSGDAGSGTLRQALADANDSPVPNLIEFNLPGDAPHVIELLSPLPAILDPLVIDGRTQPGFDGGPVIEIAANGGFGGAGLVLSGDVCAVHGLAFTGFGAGLRLEGGGALIDGNYVGVSISGRNISGNAGDGIYISSAGNIIGGNGAALGNVISGNGGHGIHFDTPEAANNLVTGNVISLNALAGIAFESSVGTGNAARRNSIFSNGSLGIDLGADGNTDNDPDDSDTGPNGLQNYPILTSVRSVLGQTTIQGFAQGTPGVSVQIEFFLGSGGNDQQNFLGETNLIVGAGGSQAFVIVFPVVATADQMVTATATDAGNNTSEFALPVAVTTPPIITMQPTNVTVPFRAPATFCVGVSGTPPLTFQWRHNGVNIPDATNACYTIPDSDLPDGGSYSVVVANPIDALLSQEALLLFDLPTVAAGDDFADRVLLVRTNGTVKGSNIGATRETDEPNHFGKAGGKSVWYSWVAPAAGIAHFRTTGSTFDTMLAVYDGTALTNLEAVVSDEDRGGFFTSDVRFNVFPGMAFHIAVDGFGAEEGTFLVTWDFQATNHLLPVIGEHPRSQTVAPGGGAIFSVFAVPGCLDGHHDCRHPTKDHHTQHPEDQAKLSYQWYFNGTAIWGATNELLMVADVQEENLGDYVVKVAADGQTVDSLPASLQMNLTGFAVEPVQAMNKFEDAVAAEPLRAGGGGSGAGGAELVKGGALSQAVVRGYTGTQVFNTVTNSTQSREEPICGVMGGASAWVSFVPDETGQLFLNTDGSSFNTVMAIFKRSATNAFVLQMLDCDDNSGMDNVDSALDVPVQAGVTNFIVVDGVNSARGILHLNYSLVTLSSLTSLGKTAEGAYRLRLTGHPEMRFTLESSDALSSWAPILTTNSAGGVFDFTDSTATNSARRFYRARMLP